MWKIHEIGTSTCHTSSSHAGRHHRQPSPSHLLYGNQVYGPLDVLRQQWVPTTKTPKDATEWIQHMREMLGEMCESARRTQEENKEYSKKRHDEKASERYFAINDNVLVFSPAVTRRRGDKLSDRWQGPYKTIGEVSPVTYMVDMPECGKRLRTVHVEMLKPWVEPTESILHMRTHPEECGGIPDYHHIQMEEQPTLDPN